MSLYNVTWSIQVEKLLPPVLRDKTPIEVDDDFKIGEADNEYISYLVISSPGHWKEFPTLGVGIFKYLQSNASAAEIERAILVQLKNDIFPRPLVDASRFPVIVVNRVTIELQ